jgi:hypothetical protein
MLDQFRFGEIDRLFSFEIDNLEIFGVLKRIYTPPQIVQLRRWIYPYYKYGLRALKY